ncbi:MAG TPA: hypothetical protein VFT31_16310 [Kribbella sp.]|nr:hypothetical protein [Kribbella sp.]
MKITRHVYGRECLRRVREKRLRVVAGAVFRAHPTTRKPVVATP